MSTQAHIMSSDFVEDDISEGSDPATAPGGAKSSDPSAWVEDHGDFLYRYALMRLRDPALAEDAVQEALLAALQSRHNYAGRSNERTWLAGILKHKIMDHFRKASRQAQLSPSDEEAFEHDELFRKEGEWKDHFDPERAPLEWNADPAQLAEQGEFWIVFSRCLSPLPARIGNAFTLREVDGLTSDEICEVLGISANNLWVMLYRARTHLRRCLELNWFHPNLVKR